MHKSKPTQNTRNKSADIGGPENFYPLQKPINKHNCAKGYRQPYRKPYKQVCQGAAPISYKSTCTSCAYGELLSPKKEASFRELVTSRKGAQLKKRRIKPTHFKT